MRPWILRRPGISLRSVLKVVAASLVGAGLAVPIVPAVAQGDLVPNPETVIMLHKPINADQLHQLLLVGARGQGSQLSTETATTYRSESGHGVAVAFNMLFANNSAVMDNTAREYAKTIGIMLRDNPDMSIMLTGHANRTGPESTNDRLANLRANVVRDFLIAEFRIKGDRIDAVGLGSRLPLPGVYPEEGVNRRAQLAPRMVAQKVGVR